MQHNRRPVTIGSSAKLVQPLSARSYSPFSPLSEMKNQATERSDDFEEFKRFTDELVPVMTSQDQVPSMLSNTTRPTIENLPNTFTTRGHNEPTSTSQLFGSDPVVKHPAPFGETDLIVREELTRKMGSGPCQCVVPIGQLQVPCPCLQGIFEADVEASSINTTCRACGHALIHHQNVNQSSPVYRKSSYDYYHPTQIFIMSDKIVAYDFI